MRPASVTRATTGGWPGRSLDSSSVLVPVLGSSSGALGASTSKTTVPTSPQPATSTAASAMVVAR